MKTKFILILILSSFVFNSICYCDERPSNRIKQCFERSKKDYFHNQDLMILCIIEELDFEDDAISFSGEALKERIKHLEEK